MNIKIKNANKVNGIKKNIFFFLSHSPGKIKVKYIKKIGKIVGPTKVKLLHNFAIFSVVEISTTEFENVQKAELSMKIKKIKFCFLFEPLNNIKIPKITNITIIIIEKINPVILFS